MVIKNIASRCLISAMGATNCVFLLAIPINAIQGNVVLLLTMLVSCPAPTKNRESEKGSG